MLNQKILSTIAALPNRFAQVFSLLLAICVFFLSLYRLSSEYSYWFDELYSVGSATTSFCQMMEIIFNDVHPPLYQIILWLWVRVFGHHEFVVRSLSFLFVLGASIAFFRIAALLPQRARYFSLVLFFSSWLIPYYAQEARAYAMLLFLATLTIYCFIQDNFEKHSGKVVLLSVVLGLTHFFGLLLAALILFWLMLSSGRNHKVLLPIFFAYFAILAWPLSQFMFGSEVSHQIGGHFWITSRGPLDTLYKAASTYALLESRFDRVLIYNMPTEGIITAALAAFLIGCYIYIRSCKDKFFQSKHEFQIFQKLSFLLGGILLIVVLLDFHTPISTVRNFIVLLPVTAVVFGIAMEIIANIPWVRAASVVFIVAFGVLSLYTSYKKMEAKWEPLQNWRAAAEFIAYKVENENVGWKLFYMEPGAELSKPHNFISNYYIDRMHLHLTAKPLFMPDIERISEPFILLVGHLIKDERRDEVLSRVQAIHEDCELYSPQQHLPRIVIVLACRG